MLLALAVLASMTTFAEEVILEDVSLDSEEVIALEDKGLELSDTLIDIELDATLEGLDGNAGSDDLPRLEPSGVNAEATQLMLGVKEKYTLDAQAIGSGSKVTFKSSNKKVATVTSKGVIQGVKKGNATITGTVKGGAEVVYEVQVVAAPNRVKLDKSSISLGVKESILMTPTIPDGTHASFTWSTSDKTVATVSKTGKITGASASTITVNFATPINCREENANVAIEVAPVSLSKGFTITFTTDGGDKIEYSTSDPVTFTCDDVFRTDPASSGRMLIACGSNKVYIFDEALARASGNYKDGLIWEWDASTAKSVIGGNMDHIDDAKPVNDNKQILVTSSYNWAALVDIATKKVLWYATGVTGAHSAEILPGNLIAVACSGEHVMLFDASMPNKKLAQYDLGSAHGVVWMESVQRLYAIGGTTLQKYRVLGNALSLDQTFDTKSAVTGLHDMTKYDSNTLIMTGSRAALFNVNTNTFTNIPHFNGFVGMKSINCNPDTGEVYYTFGAEGLSEGSYTWSSHWIRYSDNYMAATPGGQTLAVDGYIRVEDINMYKVRVFSW
jgi:hypothetical protein